MTAGAGAAREEDMERGHIPAHRGGEATPLMRANSPERSRRSLAARGTVLLAGGAALAVGVGLAETSASLGRRSILTSFASPEGTNVTVVGDVATISIPGSKMFTTVDLKTGKVRHDPVSLPRREEDKGIPGVLAPEGVPDGEAHTYFPWEWKGRSAFAVPVHNDMDTVVEAPDTAVFRRRFSPWRDSLQSKETSEHAALRIFSIFPSFGKGNPELYPAVQDPAPLDPVVDHPDPPFEGSVPRE